MVIKAFAMFLHHLNKRNICTNILAYSFSYFTQSRRLVASQTTTHCLPICKTDQNALAGAAYAWHTALTKAQQRSVCCD